MFQAETREFYRLEKLWGDVPRMPLPESVTGPITSAAPEDDDMIAVATEADEDAL